MGESGLRHTMRNKDQRRECEETEIEEGFNIKMRLN